MDCWRLSRQPIAHFSILQKYIVLMVFFFGLSVVCFSMLVCVFYFVVSSPISPSATFSCLLPWLPFLVSFVACFSNWGFSWELVYSLPCWVLGHVYCMGLFSLVFFSCQWYYFCCYLGSWGLLTLTLNFLKVGHRPGFLVVFMYLISNK